MIHGVFGGVELDEVQQLETAVAQEVEPVAVAEVELDLVETVTGSFRQESVRIWCQQWLRRLAWTAALV